MTKNTKRDKLMAYITATATADSEDDVQAMLKLFNPVDDRDQMGEIYEETLGYNPITHYDIKDVIAVIDDAMDHVTSDSVRIIMKHKDEIVDKAMAIYEEKRDEHIKEAVALAMADFLSADDFSAVSFYLTGEAVSLDDLGDDEDEEDELTAEMDEQLDEDDEPDLPSLKGLEDDDGEDFDFGSEDDE